MQNDSFQNSVYRQDSFRDFFQPCKILTKPQDSVPTLIRITFDISKASRQESMKDFIRNPNRHQFGMPKQICSESQQDNFQILKRIYSGIPKGLLPEYQKDYFRNPGRISFKIPKVFVKESQDLERNLSRIPKRFLSRSRNFFWNPKNENPFSIPNRFFSEFQNYCFPNPQPIPFGSQKD